MQADHPVPQTTPFSSGDSDSAGDIDYIKLALKHKRLMVIGVLLGLGFGVIAYLKMGPSYRATTQMLVSRKASVPLRDQDARTFGERGEHVALIMSPLIVGQAVKKHQLDQLPSLHGSTDPVEDIVGNLKVKRSAGRDESFLNVLDVSYVSSRKDDAKKIVSAIVDAYRDYLKDSRTENMQEMVSLISEAGDNLEKELKEKQQEYLQFRETAPLHWNGAIADNGVHVANVHQQRVAAIEAERRQNILKRAELNSKLRAIEEAVQRGESPESLELLAQQFLRVNAATSGGTGIPTPLSGAGSPNDQLLALTLEEQKLLRDFGPEHPDVQRVRKSMEVIREYNRQRGLGTATFSGSGSTKPGDRFQGGVDLVSVYVMSLRQQLAELEHRDRELASLLTTEESKAKAVASFETRDLAYREEINRVQALWETVVGRLSELEVLKDAAGYSTKQIAPVRIELALKRLIKIFGAGMFLGLAIAGAIAVWREFQNNVIASVDDLRRHAGFPVLVGIPSFKAAVREKEAEDSPINANLTYYHRPEAPESEAYRRLRTALFVSIGTEDLKVIQFTSAHSSDGKSTVAANLALSAAQAGKKVLLIDGDLRRPSVDALFGIPREIGLAEVLAGEIEVLNAVCETTVPGLSVLTAGSMTTRPAEVLASSAYHAMLDSLRREFDYILVDTPPVLAVSDPCIAAQAADAVVFVVRLNANTHMSMQKSEELLRINGIRVLGVVANDVPQSAEDVADYDSYYSVPQESRQNRKADGKTAALTTS